MILVLKSILVQFNVKVGVTGDEDPPVPIPNTEVKLISVENTWRVTAWEDRAMPTCLIPHPSRMGDFFVNSDLHFMVFIV